jgi:hypothetical protein
MIRLKSEIFVSALVRRCFSVGAMAALTRRGADEAGAIYVKVLRLDGTADLYGPAPQSSFDDDVVASRLFEQLADRQPEKDVDARLARERNFDPDVWIVEIEDREGRHFLDLAKPPPT